MEFKVGDKVRIVNEKSADYGKTGQVFRAYKVLVLVTFDGRYASFFDYTDIAPDERPDDALPATVEQPDDSNRSIYTPVTETTDNVNHPQHYKHGEVETLDIIRMSLTPEEFQGFLKGNVLKYQLRAPFKHATPDEDYKKAKYYYDEYREETE